MRGCEEPVAWRIYRAKLPVMLVCEGCFGPVTVEGASVVTDVERVRWIGGEG